MEKSEDAAIVVVSVSTSRHNSAWTTCSEMELVQKKRTERRDMGLNSNDPTEDVKRIIQRLKPYYLGEEIAVWLCVPHPQLAGDIPAAVINSGDVGEVDAIIDRLDSDGYL